MDITQGLSGAFLLVSLALFLLSALLWVIAGQKMLLLHDYLGRSGVSLVSTLLFFLGLALVGFSTPIPTPVANAVGLALIMFYVLPVLIRLSALLSGGVEKRRRQEQDNNPPSTPSPLL